jgi:hypothetical protein
MLEPRNVSRSILERQWVNLAETEYEQVRMGEAQTAGLVWSQMYTYFNLEVIVSL